MQASSNIMNYHIYSKGRLSNLLGLSEKGEVIFSLSTQIGWVWRDDSFTSREEREWKDTAAVSVNATFQTDFHFKWRQESCGLTGFRNCSSLPGKETLVTVGFALLMTYTSGFCFRPWASGQSCLVPVIFPPAERKLKSPYIYSSLFLIVMRLHTFQTEKNKENC